MTDKPDLLAVLAHYGVDARDGRVEQLVRCPVHGETHPSMTVNIVKQLFSCKACSAAGDSWTLIHLMEKHESYAATFEFGKDRFGVGGPAPQQQGGRVGLSGAAGGARGGYRPKFGGRRGLSR